MENLDKEQLKTLLAYALDYPRKIPVSERSSRQPFEDRMRAMMGDRDADLDYDGPDYDEAPILGGPEMAADDMVMHLMM